MPGLENYRALLARVDEMCGQTAKRFDSRISCRPGCDACCRHLSVFAVEAAALHRALCLLPEQSAVFIRQAASVSPPDAPCPLLHGGLCLLYQARPIICRTHGLPLLVNRDGASGIDFCPENFHGVPSIPGSAVIDLDRLNSTLAAINALFLRSSPGPERLTVAQALMRLPD
jgi:Fe-S-cluster containining protein